MDLFDRIQEQIERVRLPLFAVTVTAAAPRRPDGRGRTVYRLGRVHRILLSRGNNLLQRAVFTPS
ncbi:hypothetical protein DIE19_32070 [Burkholderia sp. Bp9126]|nr:hypothetical protein DIE19_32070 [Burkholderia sp. Bp9126]